MSDRRVDDGHAELAGLSSDYLALVGERWRLGKRLVAAEARLALGAFLLMVFGAMLAAGAVLFAWAFLILTLGQGLQLAGLDRVLALGLLCLLHLAAAWGLWRGVNRMSRHLEFRVTRRLFGAADA